MVSGLAGRPAKLKCNTGDLCRVFAAAAAIIIAVIVSASNT